MGEAGVLELQPIGRVVHRRPWPGQASTELAGQGTDSRHQEGWAEIDLLNRLRRGGQLVFQGRQSAADPLALYALAVEADAEPVELDDEPEGVESAVFTAGGQSVLYTARVGDERDAVDVGLVATDGEKKPRVLYEKAFLVDVRWDDLDPFLTLFVGDQ